MTPAAAHGATGATRRAALWGRLWVALPGVASRLLAGLGLVAIIALLPWLSGSKPEYTVLRARYADRPATPEVLAQIRAELGLDAGPLAIFGRWLGGILRGDLGTSWVSGHPVGPGALKAFGVSLTLMGWALLVAAIVATVLVLPVIRSGLRGQPRRGSGIASAVLTALPEFLLAIVLLLVLAVWLRWLPPYGWRTPANILLPALALGIPAGGLLGRLLGDALAGAFAERWVQTWALAKASDARIAAAALRRALPSVIGQVALVVIGLTGGAVAVEEVFAIPGLGRYMIGAAASQDIPALQCAILLLLMLAVACGTLAGLVSRLLLGRAMRGASLPVRVPQAAFRRRHLLVPGVSAGLLALMVLAGFGRDPYTPAHPRLAAPSWALPFGADASGRDLLARVAHGTLQTVGLALVVCLVCLGLGLLIGAAGDWATGPVEVANAAPPIIVGVIVTALLGPSAGGAALAVAVVGWAPLAAHTQALVAQTRALPHIWVQQTWDVGPTRLLWGSIMPEVAGPVTRHALLRLPAFALSLASLGFLGLGARPPAPEWGLLLSEGAAYVERAPWTVLAPTAALALAAVLAVSLGNLAGES